ncbi:MAG TPA: hypothetical protein VFG78_07640 [Gemmatimonadota bacterium]|nr:hypothetical protein [Gemmatimonadota bacterium]
MNGPTFGKVWIAVALGFIAAACSDDQASPLSTEEGHAIQGAATVRGKDQVQIMMEKINARLARNGKDYLVGVVEFYTAGESEEQGRTVFFSDVGNKQLGHHYIAGDERRTTTTDITFIVDLADGATASGLSSATTDAAINRAMQTWQDVNCSEIQIVDLGSFNFDFGVFQFLLGSGGTPFVFADIAHAGFLPASFFDAVFGPGGSEVVLAFTITFVFIDPDELPDIVFTDLDNNRKLDTAFREIYYNDAFLWVIDQNIPGFPDFDVESVALHEAGHGFSQGHFGKAFLTNSNGKLHFSPRALMNAAYSGIQQEIKKTDNAGHCSIWAKWPNT